jgi:ArsR family transcriptional regulator
MGQSRISTHLAQLRQAGLVLDRRAGKNVLYRGEPEAPEVVRTVAEAAVQELFEAREDGRALELALQRRQDKTRAYFDAMAGRFGREYLPGRSWKALAEALLYLMPRLTIADLGAGEGTFTQLLARRAERVIAVDNAEKMVAYASEAAARNGLENVEFRLGDLEDPPIEAESVDLAFFSQSLHHAQHPERAVRAAHRILRPGGRVVILDLRRHTFEEARELYADLWLGFSEVELDRFLREAGFEVSAMAMVHRESQAPHLETVMAVGSKRADAKS